MDRKLGIRRAVFLQSTELIISQQALADHRFHRKAPFRPETSTAKMQFSHILIAFVATLAQAQPTKVEDQSMSTEPFLVIESEIQQRSAIEKRADISFTFWESSGETFQQLQSGHCN